jgi:hypothetical protein
MISSGDHVVGLVLSVRIVKFGNYDRLVFHVLWADIGLKRTAELKMTADLFSYGFKLVT